MKKLCLDKTCLTNWTRAKTNFNVRTHAAASQEERNVKPSIKRKATSPRVNRRGCGGLLYEFSIIGYRKKIKRMLATRASVVV